MKFLENRHDSRQTRAAAEIVQANFQFFLKSAHDDMKYAIEINL